MRGPPPPGSLTALAEFHSLSGTPCSVSQASQEFSEQLPAGHAEVRVAGRDATLVYVGPVTEPAEPAFNEPA